LKKRRLPPPTQDFLTHSQIWLRRYGISLLTLRILALNILTLMILAAGILYLNQYKQQLIARELENLGTEAKVFAAMIAEGATNEPGEETPTLSQGAARQMVRRLSETTRSRAQLYDRSNFLLADSHLLMGGIGTVEIETLAPTTKYNDHWNHFWRWLGFNSDFPNLPASLNLNPAVEANVTLAMGGEIAGTVWRTNENNKLVFTMAAPVQRLKQVLGAVMLVRSGEAIEQAMDQVRFSILQLVAFSMLVTTGLSVYLASSIDQPIRKLARAADLLRRNPGRSHHIPDFSHRHDEIGDLSISLREMTESIWTRMDAIDSFAADVAHELKNPLTSLRSAVETVNRISNPDQKRKLMAIIEDDVVRMDRLITDISNASRLDAELSRSDNKPVDLFKTMMLVKDYYRPFLENNKAPRAPLIFTADTPAQTSAIINGVESRLIQVLQNIISNALSFSPTDQPVSVHLHVEKTRAIITINDHGPGIPPAKLESIFDRFYSERPTGEKFGLHSGLGLSISRQIIQAHRGRIFAENRYDSSEKILGARFTIDLPLL
jgi:two-component system sensor histidine kinase ChvG